MISNSFGRGAWVSLLATALLACATVERRFQLREPRSRDTDLEPISIDCEWDTTDSREGPADHICSTLATLEPIS